MRAFLGLVLVVLALALVSALAFIWGTVSGYVTIKQAPDRARRKALQEKHEEIDLQKKYLDMLNDK